MSSKAWKGARGPGVAAAVALVALVAGTGVAQATVPVIDLPHTVKTALGWVAQYQQMLEQYKQQLEQTTTLNQQLEQMYVKGEAYDGQPGHRQQFSPRGLDVGVAERCGTEPRKHPRGAEQFEYCVAIVRTENHRFNAVVTMLEDVERRDQELQAAYAERSAIRQEEQGKLESNTNRILAIQSQLQNDVQNSATLMDAYAAAIAKLEQDQDRVARQALGGSGGIGGDLAQGVALRLALQAARTRER